MAISVLRITGVTNIAAANGYHARNSKASTFSGYAPVLDAVAAVLLREENHFSVSNTARQAGRRAAPLQKLKRILDNLLVRDQRKMKPVASQLGLDPSITYTPSEQIDWLCHDLEGGSAPELSHIADPKLPYLIVIRYRDHGAARCASRTPDGLHVAART